MGDFTPAVVEAARAAVEALVAELEAESADADQWKDRAERAERERAVLLISVRRIQEWVAKQPTLGVCVEIEAECERALDVLAFAEEAPDAR